MRRISDYKDEEALDLLAALIEPATDIFADTAIREANKNGGRAKAVSVAIKNHKRSVMEILAILDGVSVEDYHCNVITLPAKLIEILNDPELIQLFSFAGQNQDETASGSHTENTEAVEQ